VYSIVGDGVDDEDALCEHLEWRGASTDRLVVLEERALKKHGSLPAELLRKAQVEGRGCGCGHILSVRGKDSLYRNIVHGLPRVYGLSSASFYTQHHERVIAICLRKNYACIFMQDLKPVLSACVFGESRSSNVAKSRAVAAQREALRRGQACSGGGFGSGPAGSPALRGV
jgi:hypothetical protein